MPNTFDWIEIRTGDMEKAARLYEGLFGWKVIEKETADGFDVWIFDTGRDLRISEMMRAYGGAPEAARLIEDFARAQG